MLIQVDGALTPEPMPHPLFIPIFGLLLHVHHPLIATPALQASGAGQAETEAPEAGLVRFGSRWVMPEDLYRYERGFVPTESGTWQRASAVAALEEGLTRVDLDYLNAEELKQSKQGLYKCGKLWLDLPDANDYHSRLLRWWRIPNERFVAYSTCDRAVAEEALGWMSFAHGDLVRLFGTAPKLPITVIVLRSLVQYSAFSVEPTGDQAFPPETRGFSAFHHAYLCDQWLDSEFDNDFPGAACAYWDNSTEAGRAWGPFAVRHAAAQAFVEALDPSPDAVRSFTKDPSLGLPGTEFWVEKDLPAWLRYGAASYCERFFVDRQAEDPLWARTWSLGELSGQGGLGDLEAAFRCELDPKEVGRSAKLMLEAGAIVAFILDGQVPAVAERHRELQAAIKKGQNISAAVAALEAAVLESEQQLRIFSEN